MLTRRVGVVSDNIVADSVISAGEHHCETSQTHLHELLIAALSVVDGTVVTGVEDIRLHIPVGERMHPRRVRLVVNGQEILQKSFVQCCIHRIVRVVIDHGIEVGICAGRQGLKRKTKQLLHMESEITKITPFILP